MTDPKQLRAAIAADARASMAPSEIARKHNVSVRTVYRHLAGRGLAVRRHRADGGRGQKAMRDEVFLELLALVDVDGLAPEQALKILEANGRLRPGEFSPGWVNRRLRDLAMTQADAARHGPRTYRRRESSRPNARHQADASPAASIYLDTNGDIIYEPADPLKKEAQALGRTRVHVFCLVDDYSRAVYLRAYDGETFENWMDFLFRAWSVKPHADEFPFYGLPRLLYCDNGSGLAARPLQCGMREIGVKIVPHPPGQPWKKGKAEAQIQRYQKLCEPLTRRMVFQSFDELNLFLEQAALYLNNLTHGSTHETPFARWRTIAPDKLVAPPPREEWQRLCLWEEETRVYPDYTIRFGRGSWHEEVELPDNELIARYVGKRIRVLFNRWAADPIILILQPLAGLPGRELRVPRVRPGTRPPGQADSNMVTLPERLMQQARAADLSHLDLTAHMVASVELHPPVQAGSQRRVDSSRLFREQMTQMSALTLGQQLGAVSMPATEGDQAFIAELFGEAETVDRELVESALAELKRVKEERRAHSPA